MNRMSSVLDLLLLLFKYLKANFKMFDAYMHLFECIIDDFIVPKSPRSTNHTIYL